MSLTSFPQRSLSEYQGRELITDLCRELQTLVNSLCDQLQDDLLSQFGLVIVPEGSVAHGCSIFREPYFGAVTIHDVDFILLKPNLDMHSEDELRLLKNNRQLTEYLMVNLLEPLEAFLQANQIHCDGPEPILEDIIYWVTGERAYGALPIHLLTLDAEGKITGHTITRFSLKLLDSRKES
jgi:hypothetical protein